MNSFSVIVKICENGFCWRGVGRRHRGRNTDRGRQDISPRWPAAELMQKFDYSDDSASYLRPGDTLTIEIEVDPSFSDEGFMVKWSSNYVDDQAGERLVKFVLPIENRHVGRELPISVKIVSHQDWHRHQVWDDFWQVTYRVLPPG